MSAPPGDADPLPSTTTPARGSAMNQPDALPPFPPPPSGPVPVFDLATLMRGRREIIIRNEGVEYRLRLTRFNKLILTK